MRAGAWDVFCRVVDNYGDIGIGWRLARQLACEHRIAVRLWVDDLAAFARLCPAVDPLEAHQSVESVEIFHWRHGADAAVWQAIVPADAVIELFGCGLPNPYIDAMARNRANGGAVSIWIDFEYLSAEPWIETCHGVASPHPRLSLTKYFFYPGFTAHSGGLIVERDLDGRRVEFQRDANNQARFWQMLGIRACERDERRVSLFGYANPALVALFAVMAADTRTRWTVAVPEGVMQDESMKLFGTSAATKSVQRRGALTVWPVAFQSQDAYDELLWACDVNFVRGEDSFVRAQWAARPFVWHIYAQDGGTHRGKLDAFLDRYQAGLNAQAALAQRRFWHAWNGLGGEAGAAWEALRAHEKELRAHAEAWPARARGNADLAHNLVRFVAGRRAELLK